MNLNGSWKIVEGTSHWKMLDFGGKEKETWQSLWTIWKYDFNCLCFVGRPGPSTTYFRRLESGDNLISEHKPWRQML